jgi:hypothetical protein
MSVGKFSDAHFIAGRCWGSQLGQAIEDRCSGVGRGCLKSVDYRQIETNENFTLK